jgi:hypothetical protein
MQTASKLVAFSLLTSLACAADLPTVPTASIAKKKDLLFSENFDGTPAKEWRKVVDTFAVENGVLKGTQTRTENKPPGPDGKGGVRAHAAVHGLEIPTKDSVVEVKVRLEGATMMDVEFDDRKFTGSHYGHICRAQVKPTGVTIIDEKEGSMRNDIYELSKDPTKKEERKKLMEGRSVTYPMKLEQNKWYTLVVETVGDAMRVTIDGQPAAYLKSPGIAHETKSRLEFGVAGQSGLFDELKVWSAEPAK